MTAKTSLAGRLPAVLRHPSIRVPLIGNIEEKAVKTQLLCAIALGLAGTASAAAAQTGPESAPFHLSSSVEAFCSALTAAPTALDLGAMAPDGDGRLPNLFANNPTYEISGYYCNMPARIEFSAAPLMHGSPGTFDANLFTNRIDYQATLDWGDLTPKIDDSVNAAASELEAGTAHTGALVLSFSDPVTAGNIRPLSGDYTGSVTLTVVFNP